MTEEMVNMLADQVRLGMGLRQAIREEGLPKRETLVYLKKNHRALFKEAKAEYNAALSASASVS